MLFRLEMNQTQTDFQNASTYYGQVAYRIGEWVTPILRYERFDPDRDSSQDAHQQWLLGVNLSPHAKIYLKSEILFRSSDKPLIDSNRLYLTSFSVAF